MILNGMNIARINMSHQYDHSDLKDVVDIIREQSNKLDLSVAIMFDLCGPKIRVTFKNKSKKIVVNKDQVLTLGHSGTDIPNNIPIKFGDIEKGAYVKIDDGSLSFKVESVKKTYLTIRSESKGTIFNGKGINFPGITLDVSTITQKDVKDIKTAVKLDIDWLAMSFVRSSEDINKVKDILDANNYYIPIIAKIEKPEALENLNSIVNSFDGILVARGDLGVEMPLNRLPLLQNVRINDSQSKPNKGRGK